MTFEEYQATVRDFWDEGDGVGESSGGCAEGVNLIAAADTEVVASGADKLALQAGMPGGVAPVHVGWGLGQLGAGVGVDLSSEGYKVGGIAADVSAKEGSSGGGVTSGGW